MEFLSINWSAFSTNLLANLFAIILLILGIYLNKLKEIELALRDKKIEVYKKFIDYLFKVVQAKKQNKPIPEKDMETFMVNFNKELIFWGSDSFIKKYNEWKLRSKNCENYKFALYFEDLLREIRKDTGHKNNGFNKHELLNVIISDLEDIVKTEAKN
jgi:hypothetical protein